MCVGVVKVPRTPGGHEEQEGGGAGGVTVPLLQGAALLPAQVTAGNQIPEEGQKEANQNRKWLCFSQVTLE